MIDIQKMMIQAMKKQLFPNNDELNIAARQVLGEMKTKIKDINMEKPFTIEMQYKMFQKMKKDRENLVEIYEKAFKDTGSEVAKTNLEKAKNELEPIDLFILELESQMPKKMTEAEIEQFIDELIAKFDDKPNMGMIMKLIKSNTALNIDMAIASKIIKEKLK
jgi:uncharacterized protein YqeY